jgi:tripartite-type tricarboxylate transporter receptor subunit TctC
MKLLRCLLPLACAAALAGCGERQTVEHDYPWHPNRPITIIVPWAAGGSTDQVIRTLAGDIERAMGANVVVRNTPGGSGSTGTRNALQARPDGLTWTSGAAASLGTFKLLDLLDTSLDDWHLFLAVANVSVLSVPADSPYQDFGQFMEALRENPGRIRVATAGVASSGHHAIETLAQATGIEYRHVSYPGGNPAVISTVSGETEATPQLATEQAEMIRGKRLRPLAVLASEPLELEGYGTIPPVTDWLPDLHYAPNYFGIWVRKGVPEEVIETMEGIWRDHIQNSEALQRYARNQGAFFTPMFGDEARRRTMEKVREDAWSLHHAGQAKVSPEQLGIPRPGPTE